jgi:ParB family chromosome partitioning protein
MTTILISRVLPNPEQPRRRFDPGSLRELADSIKVNGLIQPIVVEDAGDGSYILIDGERRLRACKLINRTEIEAFINPPSNHNGEERLRKALVANIQRTDLNPIEEAQAYQITGGKALGKLVYSAFGCLKSKVLQREG